MDSTKKLSLQEWDILAEVLMTGWWPGGRQFAEDMTDHDEDDQLTPSVRASISRSLRRLVARKLLKCMITQRPKERGRKSKEIGIPILDEDVIEYSLTDLGTEAIIRHMEQYPREYDVPEGWWPRCRWSADAWVRCLTPEERQAEIKAMQRQSRGWMSSG
jgi:hypothetical protein